MASDLLTPSSILLFVLTCWSAVQTSPISEHISTRAGDPTLLVCPTLLLDSALKLTLWILNDDQTVLSVENDIDRSGAIRLADSGSLVIASSQVNMSGVYRCLTQNTKDKDQQAALVRLTVVPQVLIASAWERNKNHFILGAIAAAVVTAVFAAGCAVYKFRWKSPKSDPLFESNTYGGYELPSPDQQSLQESVVAKTSSSSGEELDQHRDATKVTKF